MAVSLLLYGFFVLRLWTGIKGGTVQGFPFMAKRTRGTSINPSLTQSICLYLFTYGWTSSNFLTTYVKYDIIYWNWMVIFLWRFTLWKKSWHPSSQVFSPPDLSPNHNIHISNTYSAYPVWHLWHKDCVLHRRESIPHRPVDPLYPDDWPSGRLRILFEAYRPWGRHFKQGLHRKTVSDRESEWLSPNFIFPGSHHDGSDRNG